MFPDCERGYPLSLMSGDFIILSNFTIGDFQYYYLVRHNMKIGDVVSQNDLSLRVKKLKY